MSKKETVTVPNGLKFAFGGSAGMIATLFVQPLDLIKNRMQLSKGKESMTAVGAFKDVVAKEGVFALYNGVSAGLLRQATYTTARLGIFNWLLDLMTSSDGQAPGFAAKAGAGMLAGMAGSFVGNPADVCLIRMTADGRLPPAERRNYKHVFDALAKIFQEGGVGALWKGAVPTMARAIVVNAAQLATYSQAKQMLVDHYHLAEGIFLHFISSMISGLVTAAASMPVDIVKTRVQNAKGAAKAGPVQILIGIVKDEGILKLWKGFFPYYFRIGPHTVLTFIFLEQMNSTYYKIMGGKSGGGA